MYFKLSEGNCIESCPNNIFLTNNGNCLKIDPTLLNKQNSSFFKSYNETINSTEFKEIISDNISNFVDSSTIINGSDFKAIIISSKDINPKEQIKNGISGIDLGKCIEVLKNEYNVPNEKNLIILEIESKDDEYKIKIEGNIDLGKEVELAVYDDSGNLLNLEFCKNEIIIMNYIGDLEGIDLLTAENFAEQGIDVFNAKDSFFNDICHPFKNRNNSDITMKDRRNDLFQNVSFCGDLCEYNGINYDLMAAKCICQADTIQIKTENDNLDNNDNKNKKGLTLNDVTNSFTSNLFSFNFIMKSYSFF